LIKKNTPETPSNYDRLLIDAITDYAIYMLDPEGRVSNWNTGAQRFKGYKPEEIIGKNFSHFYTPEDQAAGLPQRFLEISARTGSFEGEGWRVRKDGSRFWAHVVIDPIRDETGKLIGFAKITRDLTERRQAEEKLRQTQEQFRLLVQGVTDYAIYMLDPEGRVSNWNAGAERIKGYRPEEIIGEHFSKFYRPEDRENNDPQKSLDTAITHGKFEKEGWRVRKDGTHFWAHVVIDAIHDEAGKLIGFAKITRDITDKMKTQQVLEQTREALFHSQKTEAIGRLTGGIAHDFNNLLMVIIGSLRLLQRRVPNDPKISTLVDNALQGAERGTVLIQRMLAFARRQDLKKEIIDLGVLVQGLTNLLGHTLGSAISIVTKLPVHLPSVIADANQLENALLNLVVNARDAMPEGGKTVISAQEVNVTQPGSVKPGTYVCLAVSDSGEGMDEETLRRATEPFFTTKGVGKGTGLGLSMVQGLAEQFGGQFVIKSQKGKGTTAELWLPASDAHHVQNLAEPQAPHPVKTAPLTILAVDDDALVLQNITNMLEELGHTIIPASAAIKAYDILSSRDDINLVITDQVMPNITGIQLGKMIQGKWPHLPIILATGYAEVSEDTQLRYTRLAKPFTQEDLSKAISDSTAAKA